VSARSTKSPCAEHARAASERIFEDINSGTGHRSPSVMLCEHSEMETMSTKQEQLTDGSTDQAFENTSTSVAASQMRNALNNLADTVTDPKDKQVCCDCS